jgi:hypothetical protein
VAADDIAGRWHYQPLGGGAEVSLVLNRDGTFHQNVSTDNGQQLVVDGLWRTGQHAVELFGVLVDFDRGWEKHDEAWSIIDWNESPTGFAILGGSVDPDSDVVLRYDR